MRARRWVGRTRTYRCRSWHWGIDLSPWRGRSWRWRRDWWDWRWGRWRFVGGWVTAGRIKRIVVRLWAGRCGDCWPWRRGRCRDWWLAWGRFDRVSMRWGGWGSLGSVVFPFFYYWISLRIIFEPKEQWVRIIIPKTITEHISLRN